MIKKTGLIIILTVFLINISCIKKSKIEKDPFYSSFYEKARLIMSKEEQNIYKHLPDKKSKLTFIKEFWKKRDPNPETEINESKLEFEKRIAYANRWFKENKSMGRGWSTERGRILILLGFPDRREFGEAPIVYSSGRLATTKRIPMERWFYYRYQLYIEFRDTQGFGEFKLYNWPPNLLTAIDLAKYSLDLTDKSGFGKAFKFKSDFQNNKIVFKIKTDRISFDEINEKEVIVKIKANIDIYLNYKKIITIQQLISKKYNKEKVLQQKYIEFSIDFKPEKKGKYYLDIILKDMISSKRYRNFINFKY